MPIKSPFDIPKLQLELQKLAFVALGANLDDPKQNGPIDAAPSARAPAPVRLAAAERNCARPGFARAGSQRSSVARNTGFVRKTAAPGLMPWNRRKRVSSER